MADKKNLSYTIFLASILFSVSYLVQSAVEPIIQTYRLLAGGSDTANLLLDFLKYSSLFVVISLVLSAINNFIAIWLFTYLTKEVDELNEIRNGNIGVGLVTGVIVISMAMFLKSGLGLLLTAIIPFPEVHGVM